MKICDFCKQEFKIKYKHNKNKFCSFKCRVEMQRKTLRAFNKNRIGKTYEEFFTKTIAKKTKAKISKATREYSLKVGRVPPSRKGIHDSDTTRKRKSDAFKKMLIEHPEIQEHRLKALFKRPTSLEKEMMSLISEYQLPYRYVGNGKVWIGGKNPDFINEDTKTVIEVGNVFHHQGDYTPNRIKHFADYGWRAYVFIANKLNKGEILQTLNINVEKEVSKNGGYI